MREGGKAMQSALRLKTTVLPGGRIEVCAPELMEGEDVEIIVLKAEYERELTEKQGVWDFVQSLPTSRLTADDWQRIEREFHEERNAWGD
jgi:hypothetical protein